MDRTSAMPLYNQVAVAIRDGIRRGVYPSGEKILSERELCKSYNVSRITVIRALNELAAEGLLERRVGSGTFVAEKNSAPHTDVTGGTVGFIAPLLRGDPFFSDIVSGAEHACSEKEISLTLAFSKGSSDVEWRCIQRLKEQGVLGIILFMNNTSASWQNVQKLVDDGMFVVLIDHRAVGVDDAFDTVTSDNLRGGFLATQHLLDLGHRRIGLLTQKWRISSVVDRDEGYRLALANAGIAFDPELVVAIDIDQDPGVAALDMWRGSAERPTALFAINDSLALSMMQACKAESIDIPADISIVGFDDNVFAALSQPALTTIKQDRDPLGRIAVEYILKRAAGDKSSAWHSVLPVDLVVRESTGKCCS